MDFAILYGDLQTLVLESIGFGKIALIVGICFAFYKITNFIFSLISRHLSAKHWVFNGLLIAVRKPLRFFFLFFGVAIILQEIVNQLGMAKITWISKFEILDAIFCITWASIRFIIAVKKHILDSNDDYEDKTLVLALSQIITITIIITALLIGLHVLHVNIAGFLALGGIGGVAIGFASKDLLSNFFGALMIYLDKPFQVGDWICSPEKQIEGIVESIGWRQVKIMTFETRPIYVPNSLFSTIIIENPTRMSHRRFKEAVGIRYEDLYIAESILQDIKLMVTLNEDVDKERDIIVNIVGFAELGVNICILCYTKETGALKFHIFRQEILLEAGKIIEKYGAQLVCPVKK